MLTILIINGPNLNLLGEREPAVYGRTTLEDIKYEIAALAEKLNILVEFFQSNHEGAIIDYLHANRKSADGVVMNPGAFTHYSYAIRDAIAGIKTTVAEVHISNTLTREEFRHNSVIGPVCRGCIMGFGLDSYQLAVQSFLIK